MNKQQLATKIWEAANKMRSKIEANEYKDFILGFIFYKFLSDKEEEYLLGMGCDRNEFKTEVIETNENIRKTVQNNIGYFIEYKNLYSTWLGKGIDFDVSDVAEALNAFERLISPTHKKVFKGIFNTLSTGLTKLGDNAKSQTKAISDLLYLIKDIPMDGKQDYDVLGYIYEYLISNFASNAGKKAGEFYTPHEVSALMSEIVANHLKDKKEICIYDPTSGSGSLLINIGKSVAKLTGEKNRIKYYAQELKENTYNLTRMNLVMRGILPSNIVTRCGDTLEEDWPYFEENDPSTYNPLYVDAVVSNPPYSQQWNPADRENDVRYSRFGLAPKGKADYAFLLHDLYHVKPDGIMNIVLPHGVLFRGGEEGTIRKNLVEYNHIDAIIGLPANIFFGTGIPTIIMVLKQKRENTDILIIDASKGFEKVGKNNKLRASDIKKIADTVAKRVDVPKFARVVSLEEIRANDYNLNIPRYVDSSEKPESWDIYASMFGGIPNSELEEYNEHWAAFSGLREALFAKENESYCTAKTKKLKKEILNHDSVKQFKNNYVSAFAGFDAYLKEELMQAMAGVNIAKEEAILSDDIFSRIKDIPLVDSYAAYQLLDDEWNIIAVDLEIIQTEGREAIRQVDPNLVLKKKDGKDSEVQEGWKGHVIPFGLVQKVLMKEELAVINEFENRLSEISSSYEEEIENLPEEAKEADYINEGAFVWAEVKKVLKTKEAEPEILSVLKKVNSLNEEEKRIKKELKSKEEELHLNTKKKIESLTDDEIDYLLHEKWIVPLVNSLSNQPDSIVSDFAGKIEKLVSKYETTMSDVEEDILRTEKELASMLGNLVGNDFDMKGIAELKKMLGEG